MTLSPRQAIDAGQVWLRPFGHFVPSEQGYMGFSTEQARSAFLNRIDDGALVLIWTRTRQGEPGWIGRFRGILQLSKTAGPASRFSSASGARQAAASDKDFSYAVQATRAWEADPGAKVMMKQVIPSEWPHATQHLGTNSGQMSVSELAGIESLRIREVPVFDGPAISVGSFSSVKGLFV